MGEFAWSPDAIHNGHGMAFWFDGQQLHWGDTHYMIFHRLFHDGDPNFKAIDDARGQEQGVFGWVFPESYEESYSPDEPKYYVDIGSDFGMGANKANPHLNREAIEAVEHDIGYPAENSYHTYARMAGHAYETDDLDALPADPHEICENCGSQYTGYGCDECGYQNLEQWTPLNTFKGSFQKTAGVPVDGEYYSCFGFVNGILYLGNRHHMGIMQQMLDHGMTWEQLMSAPQIWGWLGYGWGYDGEREIEVGYSTDAASIDPGLDPEVKEALASLTGISNIDTDVHGASNEEYAPDWDSHYGPEGIYKNESKVQVLVYNYKTGTKEIWGREKPQGVYEKEPDVDDDHLSKVAANSQYGFPGNPYSCYGYINGHLYLGQRHHMAIMNYLLLNGWDWEQLANAPQMWGWIWGVHEGDEDAFSQQGIKPEEAIYDKLETNRDWGSVYRPAPEDRGYYRATTDAGSIDVSLIPDVGKALMQAYGIPFYFSGQMWQSNEDYAPRYDRYYQDVNKPLINVEEFVPPRRRFNQPQAPSWMPQGLYPVPTQFNPDAKTPPVYSWVEDEEFNKLAQALDGGAWMEYNINSRHAGWEDEYLDELDDDGEEESMPKKPYTDYTPDGPNDLDGWKVYEMESGEYPDHDAIWIDRSNHIIVVNYQGHHSPMFEQYHQLMADAGYPQVAGHFRTAPSTTEPFPAGWGWHGHEASPEEKEVLKKILTNHYQVEKLKHLYKPNENAEENYFEAGVKKVKSKISLATA